MILYQLNKNNHVRVFNDMVNSFFRKVYFRTIVGRLNEFVYFRFKWTYIYRTRLTTSDVKPDFQYIFSTLNARPNAYPWLGLQQVNFHSVTADFVNFLKCALRYFVLMVSMTSAGVTTIPYDTSNRMKSDVLRSDSRLKFIMNKYLSYQHRPTK